MKKEEISLVDALSYAHRKELPKPLEEGSEWVRAIVRVRKSDTSVNYAIADNDGDGNPVIIKDFGNPSVIMRIEDIYPYYLLRDYSIPILKNKKDIIEYLGLKGYDKEYISNLLSTNNKDGENKSEDDKNKDKELIRRLIIKCAIKYEIDNINAKSLDDYYGENRY